MNKPARHIPLSPLTDLWTEQPTPACLTLPYRADPTLVDFSDPRSNRAAYTWMAAQLALIDPPPTPGALPVWAYLTPPDRPAEPGFAWLHLRVPRTRLLISDLRRWELILLGVPLLTEPEILQHEQWHGQPEGCYHCPDPRAVTQREQSRLRCLEPHWHEPAYRTDHPRRTQAVLWEIRPTDLIPE